MRTARLSLVISVIALVVAVAALVRKGPAGSGPPRLAFEKLEHDSGRARPQKILKAAFPFRNAGREELRLHIISPCCGIRASASAYELAPGASGVVTVEWRPERDIGEDRQTVTVWSNDPARRSVDLAVTAEVQPPFEVDPPQIDFGGVLYDTEAARQLRVASPDERPIVLKQATTCLPGVRVECPTLGTGAMSHTITLATRPSKPPRFLSGELRVETDRSEGYAIALPVTLRVEGRVRPFPKRVLFAADERGEAAERTVALEGRGGLAFKIVAAWFTRGPFRVDYENAPGVARQEIRVRFLPSEMADGRPASGELCVQTDLDGEPVVRVPLYVQTKGAARGSGKPGSSPYDGRGADADEAARGDLSSPAAGPALEVWLFYYSGCRGCREALDSVRRAERARKGRLRLTVHDVVRDPRSVPLMLATAGPYPNVPRTLPSMIVFVGDELLLGTGEVARGAEALFDRQLARGGEHLRVRRSPAPTHEGSLPPAAEARRRHLRIVPVVLAGLADGVNPCALAAMVLLVSILSAAKMSGGRDGQGMTDRASLLVGGASFCAAVFATYYLAGLGLFLGARGLAGFPTAEAIVFWAVWTLAVAAGFLSAADAVTYLKAGDPSRAGGRLRLKVPEAVRRRFGPILRGRFSRYGLVLGGLAGGVVIALLEGICTGQMYLPTIQYMARTPGLRTSGALWLLLYNLLFVLPLIAILAVALAGVHFRRLSAFLTRHLGASKLALAAVFFLLAAVMFLGR